MSTYNLADTIKSYQLVERIGTGGFGEVYRAYQSAVDRHVAIKVILPEYASQPEFIRRFEAEAKIIAHLEHVHIVPLYDFWREPTGAFLVMRWFPSTLRRSLASGPWSTPDISRLLDQICSALTIAHRRGIIHRDIKPDNILLDEESNGFLADFGIAKSVLPDGNESTDDHRITGSVRYMSPEQIRGEAPTPQTDIYSLGIVLFELLTGVHPFSQVNSVQALIYKHLFEQVPSVTKLRQDLPPLLDTVIQRAVAKEQTERYQTAMYLARDFRNLMETHFSVAVERPAVTFQATTFLFGEGDATLIEGVELGNPYKGLQAFQEVDALNFYGRENLIMRLVKCVRMSRFLAIIGPSGSGKSSVVKAGLVPILRRSTLTDSNRWFIVEIVPGAEPIKELETALLSIAANPPIGLLEQLQQDEQGLLHAVNRVLPADDNELVLIIDQFEEVFTRLEDAAVRAHFLNSLAEAVTNPQSRLRLIITLRADFYDRPLIYPRFAQLIRENSELVLPLTLSELEEAIVKPAARVGLELEDGLVTTILGDVAERAGALPLLQFALTELYEHRRGNLLTLSSYENSGGVLGALARRAEELYVALPSEQQTAAQQVFLRLVTLGEGTEDTRRRIFRTEVSSIPNSESVLENYGRFRLLTFDRDPSTRNPTVEVAHESLIRSWHRLSEWLNSSRDLVRTHRRLTLATNDWLANNREPSFLATGERLTQFGTLTTSGIILNLEEQTYLDTSLEQRNISRANEESRKRHELHLQHQAVNRLRYLVFGLVAFLIITSLLGFSTISSREAALTAANHQATQQQIALYNAATAEFNLHRLAVSESNRLAAEAKRLLESSNNTEAETAALLGIRALKTAYTTIADSVLQQALKLLYTRKIFTGHTDAVTMAVFSPDGKNIASASDDGTVRIWNIDTGAEQIRLTGHTAQVSSLAYTPDGKALVTGSYDRTVRLWEVASQRELLRIANIPDVVFSVALSPDGSIIAAGCGDNVIRLWSAQSGQLVGILSGHSGSIRSVIFSLDGKQLATGSDDTTAKLWDVQSKQLIRTYVGHIDKIYSVSFSSDGKYILTGSFDRTARLWDALSERLVNIFSGHTDAINAVAFSPDGKYVITGSRDKTARLWRVSNGDLVRLLVGHLAGINSVSFSETGMQIVTASTDNIIRLWSEQDNAQKATYLTAGDKLLDIAFAPNAKLFASGGTKRTVTIWDAQSGIALRQLKGHTGMILHIAFSADSTKILTGSQDRTARLWDVATGQELLSLTDHHEWVRIALFTVDQKYILTASDDGIAHLWDLKTKAEIRIFDTKSVGQISAALSPDGKYLITGASDGSVQVWDIETGNLIRRLEGHTGSVVWVTFTPDGKAVVTASRDTTARLWNFETGQEIRRFTGHTKIVLRAVVSPDGKQLLTGSLDRTARLWDLESGQELRQFQYEDSVPVVVFSPDGQTFFTGSADGIIREWDVSYQAFLNSACQRVFRDFSDKERVTYNLAYSSPTCRSADLQ